MGIDSFGGGDELSHFGCGLIPGGGFKQSYISADIEFVGAIAGSQLDGGQFDIDCVLA